MNIPKQYQKAIRRCEPVTAEGFTFYPILVAEYDDFTAARPAIEVVQQGLQVKYATMPLLSAFYAMEIEAWTQALPSVGLFYCAILFLALSLRLGEGLEQQERVKLFRAVTDRKDPRRLTSLQFTQHGEVKSLTPVQFQRLRPILAAQNGLELVSETANPDLIEAERDIAEQGAPKLDIGIESLISTMSALSGTDEAGIETWPIRRLAERQKAYYRLLNFLICGIAETQGTKWKGGNPYPSPFYERKTDTSPALMPLDSFAGGEGAKAMQRATTGE